MPTVVVFDCESDSKPTRVGQRGEHDFRHVQCTVACALVLDASRIVVPSAGKAILESAAPIVCWRDVCPTKGACPFKALFDAFDAADVIVGYNCMDFDFPLLYKYYGSKGARRYLEHRIKTLDVFTRVRAATNTWPKLDDLLRANKLGSKSGNGAQAITLWEQNKRAELESYCMDDVRLTAQLALLPRLRVGVATLPSHVYGIGPAVYAYRMSRDAAIIEMAGAVDNDSDSDTIEVIEHPASFPSADDAFVVVHTPSPGEIVAE